MSGEQQSAPLCVHHGREPCECNTPAQDALDVVLASAAPFELVGDASPCGEGLDGAGGNFDAGTVVVAPDGGRGTAPTAPSAAASASRDAVTAVPWYRSRWCRVLAVRILMRLSMVGLVIGLGFVFSFRGAVDKYADWIAHFSPHFIAILLFTIFASLFASVAPG